MLSGASATDWALVAQSENEIRLDVVIGWQGGIGPPQLWTPLGSLPTGEYQIIVSPTILNIPEPCPPVSLSLTVGGPLGAAPVPAPMFSPPVLLLLIALLGGIGWRAMRRRGV